MRIEEIVSYLDTIAPGEFKEDYDNVGLLLGNKKDECSGILITLDVTESVIQDAIEKKCNLIVAHHPLIFRGLKSITGKNEVERSVISAIKNNISVFAVHTNLDNLINGVNGKIADLIGIKKTAILDFKKNTLKKLFTFVPVENAPAVRQAIFDAGGGNIGQYSQCSFNMQGTGTFQAKPGADPFIGEIGELTQTNELKIEVIFPAHLERQVIEALLEAHPYEEVAFDLVSLDNLFQDVGAGVIGELEKPIEEKEFLGILTSTFNTGIIRHSPLRNKPVQKIALCGGAGSFLISKALSAGADIYISSDIKYHEFFGGEGRMVIADIGHFESEQFTTDLLNDLLRRKFTNFAVLKTDINTNPVRYFSR